MHKRIVFVNDPAGGDWVGLYINGELALEGHSLFPKQVLNTLGISFESLTADEEWLYKEIVFPKNFSDVKLEVK